ncbi:MAG: LysM peptidoglycan-binding domain-containing protein [Chloroflexota bacterium]
MKRLPFSLKGCLLALVLLSLTLAACERPLQPERDEPTPTPTGGPLETQPEVIQPLPTPSPTVAAPDQGYPAPDQATTPAAEATLVGEPAATPAAEATAATEVIYQVQAGDTLGAISERFGVSVEEIAVANNLVDVDTLEVGQTLIIPAPGTVDVSGGQTTGETVHIVQFGDTLFRIGLRYGFTVEELVAYNNLTDPDRLEIGQIIRIPPKQ